MKVDPSTQTQVITLKVHVRSKFGYDKFGYDKFGYDKFGYVWVR